MKIIDRYVTKNVFVTMMIGIVVLSLVLVLGNLLKELLDRLVNQSVPLEIVLAFMAFVLPFSLTFSIPWGLLTALLLVFGRMSADNELIALRSNGVSIPRICIPVFALALTLTGICFWINADVAPRAAQKMAQALFEVATNNPIALFAADEVVDQIPDKRIYIRSKKGNELKDLTIFDIDSDGTPLKVIFAKRGELVSDPKNQQLLLKFYDARYEQRDADDPRDIYKIQQGIVMSQGMFPITLDSLYEANKKGQRLEAYTLPELKKYMDEGAGGQPLAASVEFNRRFSASLACLAFALVAVPLGITTHRKETSVGFALSLVIAFSYYFFIIIANTFFRDNPHAYPQVLIWVPNVIFLALGGVLFYRLAKR
ncbi:MAG TPA: LptF/LptG family permease [Chthoniobacterales bacterium]|jgi:lipopolysaccharide export system permease protein